MGERERYKKKSEGWVIFPDSGHNKLIFLLAKGIYVELIFVAFLIQTHAIHVTTMTSFLPQALLVEIVSYLVNLRVFK